VPQAGRGALLFIFILVLVDSIGFGIILPVLPGLIMQLTGFGIDRAARYGGWLSFVYALMQFFCAPVLGNLSDRFGRRPVLLYAVLSLGVDYLIMGLAIGGLLGSFGPRAPFFAAGALALANFVLGCFALPESLPLGKRRPFHWARANPLGTFRQMRRYPVVLLTLAALLLWQLAHQVLPSTWNFYTIAKFHWTSAQVGASLAFVGLLMALSQGVLTRVLIPWLGGERRAALVGVAAAVLAYTGYGLATQGWMMYAVGLTTFFFALTYPSMNAVASQQIPANAQGELQGAVASLGSLSAIIGPPLMTQIFSRFSDPAGAVYFPGAAFLTAAALTAGCALLFLRAMRLMPQPLAATKPAAASEG